MLVRRGYAEPGGRARFLAGEQPRPRPVPARRHARRPSSDPRSGRAPASGSACTATTTSTGSARPRSPCSCSASSAPTSTGTCRAASRRATASARETLARLARGRRRARAHRRLRDHGGRRGRRGAARSASTCRHRPPPAGRRAPRLPDRRHAPVRLSRSRSSAAPASSTSSRRRCSGPTRPSSRGHLDLVALATIADVVPLVDENRALATRGLRGSRGRRRPGLRALMRVARVDPATIDDGAVGFRLAPRINAAGRLGRPERRARAAAHRRGGDRAPARSPTSSRS